MAYCRLLAELEQFILSRLSPDLSRNHCKGLITRICSSRRCLNKDEVSARNPGASHNAALPGPTHQIRTDLLYMRSLIEITPWAHPKQKGMAYYGHTCQSVGLPPSFLEQNHCQIIQQWCHVGMSCQWYGTIVLHVA